MTRMEILHIWMANENGNEKQTVITSKEMMANQNEKQTRNLKSNGGDRTPVAGKESRLTTPPNYPSSGEETHAPLKFFDWGSFKILNVLGSGLLGQYLKLFCTER